MKRHYNRAVALGATEKQWTYLSFPTKRSSIIGQPVRVSADLLSIRPRHTNDAGVADIKATFKSAT